MDDQERKAFPMHAMIRVLRTATVAALIVGVAGCGGLGVNLSSGGSSNTANQVAITGTSGITPNPYPLLIGHTVVLVAHPSAGNVVNYGVTEAVRWDSSNPTVGVLFEPDCKTLYTGGYFSSICVFGGGVGKANSNIDGTTSNGAVGTLTIAVTN
jgi:hypothetical protein